MSRALLRSVFELRAPIARPSPSFLLPIRARHFNQTTQIIEPTETTTRGPIEIPRPSPAAASATTLPGQDARIDTASKTSSPTGSEPAPAPSPLSPTELDPSVRTLLPLLAAQPGHYITVHVHARPYLVTAGDVLRLPFRMKGVVPGDVLRLNRASVLGSRDLTLQGAPHIDERLFECRAVVLAAEAEPMKVIIKKKQRIRRKKMVKSKHTHTILRISELKINQLEELES